MQFYFFLFLNPLSNLLPKSTLKFTFYTLFYLFYTLLYYSTFCFIILHSILLFNFLFYYATFRFIILYFVLLFYNPFYYICYILQLYYLGRKYLTLRHYFLNFFLHLYMLLIVYVLAMSSKSGSVHICNRLFFTTMHM